MRLAAGNLVPADVRILAAHDLFVNESSLTGESLPVEKIAGPARDDGSPLAFPNLAFMGTYVTSGTATGVVLATGPRTHFGRLAHDIAAAHGTTSFDAGMHRYLWLMIRFMLVMVPAVFLINGFTKGDWLEALLFAIAVAVGLTPEMLPVVVTVNLAKGAIEMAGKRVIVKRLAAIQNFGAMDVLATDKTGTLTQDRVLLERHVDIAGVESPRVLEFACLNSFFQSGLRNLLDEAVLTHGDLHSDIRSGAGYVKVDEIPFDFERRRMSVVVETADGTAHFLICKGAVEEVSAACTRAEREGRVVALAPEHAGELSSVARELNEQGFRVIAVAYKEVPAGPATYTVADEAGMILLGYIAFLDPPKESAAPAIARLRASGVAIKVLTGDNALVTRHVCRQVRAAGRGGAFRRGSRHADGCRFRGTRGNDDDLREARPGREGARDPRAAGQRARRRLSRRRHQRRSGAEGGRRRDLRRFGRRHREGIGRHHPAREQPRRAARRRDRGPPRVRQRDQVPADGRQLEFRQHVQHGRRIRAAAVPADGAGADPVQQPALRRLADGGRHRQCRCRLPRAPRRWDISGIGRYMVCIGPLSSLFDYATFALMAWVFGALADPALFQTGWFVESLLSQTLIVHVIRTNGFRSSKAGRAARCC